ncbi:MAG: hypothetical protein QG609_440 [Patescibacteria group bacterium]|nr:hypothetical protein [Patescibacteria group bacterium]
MALSPTMFYLLLGVIALLVLWVAILEWRLHKLFRGKNGHSLETVIADLGLAVDNIINKSKKDDTLFEDIYKRLRKTLQKTHTVRFNPFRDHGGNQSFATSIMDEDGNGVVFSSLYSRDKVSVYAKPLSKHSSIYELSHEEKESIDKAKNHSQSS